MNQNEVKPLITSEVKQEKDDYLEVDSDEKLNFRINKHFFEGNTEVANGQKSEFGDFTDKEINEKLAYFIQFLLTNRQPDDPFKTLYNGTHRPANVPALGGVQLVDGALPTEGCAVKNKLAHTQNCMLKGFTKTAYVMDTLFKHVEKLPKELQLQQLMSDLNAAMKFFGAANLEFIQIRKEMLDLMNKLKFSNEQLFIATLKSNNHLFPQNMLKSHNKNTETANIPYKVEFPTRACSVGRG